MMGEGSTERIQDNQVLEHIVVFISVTPQFPHVCYVMYSNSRGEDTATFEHSAGLSFSLPYVQLAFALAFFRTPRPITCPWGCRLFTCTPFQSVFIFHSLITPSFFTALYGFLKQILNYNQKTLGLSWKFFLYLCFYNSCSHLSYTSYFDL